jgi:para-nitrobenzyl esterase
MIVETGSGKLEGSYNDGMNIFKGIPYAKAKRFQKAEEYHWKGIFLAKDYGNCSLQIADDKIIGTEDCLNLNILTPSMEGKLPVFVEIHGGAFQFGSNQGMLKSLSTKKKAFVHVAINYRLGALGFLYLGTQLGEAYKDTGNLGILDQIMALQWIKNNIHYFGGNPEDVTLFGNSAGAKSIGALMISPLSKHLFQQVILSSGAIQAIRTLGTAEALTKLFLDKTGITDAKELITMDVDLILKAQNDWCSQAASTCFFGPVEDGVVIPHQWEEEICSDRGWKGRAIIGSNLHECIWLKEDKELTVHIEDIIKDLFGNYAEFARSACKNLEEGRNLTESEIKDIWVKVVSDYMYRSHAKRLTDILAERGQKVWSYSFEYAPASHAQDIIILNGEFEQEHKEMTPKVEETIRNIRETLEELYCQFIVHHDPNGGKVPLWIDASRTGANCLILDEKIMTRSLGEVDYLIDFPFSSTMLG